MSFLSFNSFEKYFSFFQSLWSVKSTLQVYVEVGMTRKARLIKGWSVWLKGVSVGEGGEKWRVKSFYLFSTCKHSCVFLISFFNLIRV